jgi:hypothetical protein
LDLGGITGKLEGNADKIGLAIGILGPSAGVSNGDIIGDFGTIINGITHTPHIPDFQAMLANLTGGGTVESQYFMGGLEAWIVGWILAEVDIHPMIGRIGRFAKKAGINVTLGTTAYTMLEYAGKYTK